MTQETTGVCADQGAALTSYLDSLLSLEFATPAPPAAVVARSVESVPAFPMTCVVFSIAGLKLAIPLERVTAILDYAQCTGQPHPPAQLGVIEHQGRAVPVLDIAHIVMPQTAINDPYSHVVVVDGRCAWACHKVDTVIEVMSNTVRWKSDRTKRRWLAGMIATPPSALLDVEELMIPRNLADTVA